MDHAAHGTTRFSLNATALSATIHCLTGCAVGEVLGMVLGTALGWDNWMTVGASIGLAFVFGYSFTLIPLVRSGIALASSLGLAFASDTLSIAVMEVIDNMIMMVVPGAMEAGLDTLLFWGTMLLSLVLAGATAFPLNRWLIARGKGHAVVHAVHAKSTREIGPMGSHMDHSVHHMHHARGEKGATS